MLSVFIPGLILCLFALQTISQQAKSRELKWLETHQSALLDVQKKLDTKIQESLWLPFQQINSLGADVRDRTRVERALKEILLKNPLVSYPFLMEASGEFIFPLPHRINHIPPETRFPRFPDKSTAALYTQGKVLELQERRFNTALGKYLACLEKLYPPNPPKTSDPHLRYYLQNAIGRCYIKMGKYLQAQTYYQEILGPHKASPPLKELDPTLYLEVLHQSAVCHRQLQDIGPATSLYLLLYEEILHRENLGIGETLSYFKNEALDYLNQHVQKADTILQRFQKAKYQDRLETLGSLDISLRWRFFDPDDTGAGETEYTGETGGSPKAPRTQDIDYNSARFARLQEFYLPRDEKTLFYSQVKKAALPFSAPFPAIQTTILPGTGAEGRLFVAYSALPITAGSPPLLFGFLMSPALAKNTEFKTLLHPPPPLDPELEIRWLTRSSFQQLAANSVGPFPVVHVYNKTYFKDHLLVLLAPYPHYIRRLVNQDIRLNYLLVSAFILLLGLGLLLIYQYQKRENQLLGLKEEFIAQASHTLRTPLTRIRLIAEKLQLGWIADETKKQEYLTSLLAETERMNQLISSMLDFSKIEAGKKLYHPEPDFLPEILHQCLATHKNYLSHAGFQVYEEISPTLPPLTIDKQAMLCIFDNLIQNACLYSIGEKWLALRLYLSQERTHAVMEVEDHGIGMSERELKKIFHRFYRVPNPLLRHVAGSGLGLYLVQHAVTAHGGYIEVKSQPGKGTLFKIFLPLTTHPKKEESHHAENPDH